MARRRHLHLRDGSSLTAVVPFTARVFGRAVVLPNLKPPVRTLADAAAYRQRVLAAVPPGAAFEPLMTLYLTGAPRAWCALRAAPRRLSCAAAFLYTDNTTPADIAAAAASGFVAACKYYPAGATTNSADGVTDVRKARGSAARMCAAATLTCHRRRRCALRWRPWPRRGCRCWCTAR